MATEYVSLNEIDDFIKERKDKYNEDITPWFKLLLDYKLRAWWKTLNELQKFPVESGSIHKF
jgi:hypothetical protein